jgi:organic radical activating enzyme
MYDEFTFKHGMDYVYVDWDITSRCNFSCYYCNPEAHDGKYNFPELDTAKNFVDKVQEEYKDIKKFAVYNIFGGEPTIWRELSDFSKHVKAVNPKNIVQLLTNGNKTVTWWKRNAPYIDKIIVSVHVAQADIVELVNKFNAVADDIVIDFQLAMDMQIFDKCVEFYNYAEKNLHPNISLKSKPLRKMLGDSELMPYTLDQKTVLSTLKNKNGRHIDGIASPMIKKYQGSVVDQDVDITQLVLKKENNWNGWACWIGIDTINITREGNITIGSQCNPDIILGNINNLNFKFPLKPIICKYQTCGCYADIHTRKVKNYKGDTL